MRRETLLLIFSILNRYLWIAVSCDVDSDCDQSNCPLNEPCMKCFSNFGAPFAEESNYNPWIMNGLESQCVRSPWCYKNSYGNCPVGYECWRIPGNTPWNREAYTFGCIQACDPGSFRVLSNSARDNCPWTGYPDDKVDSDLRTCVWPPLSSSIANETDNQGNTYIRNPAPPLCKSGNVSWDAELYQSYPANTLKNTNGTGVAWVNNCTIFSSEMTCLAKAPICKWIPQLQTPCNNHYNCESGVCNMETKTCSSTCVVSYPKVCLPCLGLPWSSIANPPWPAPFYQNCSVSCQQCPKNTYKNLTGDNPHLCLPCPKSFTSIPGSPKCCLPSLLQSDGTCQDGNCRYTEWQCTKEDCPCEFPEGRGWGGAIHMTRSILDIPYGSYPYPVDLNSTICAGPMTTSHSCGPTWLRAHWIYIVSGIGGIGLLIALVVVAIILIKKVLSKAKGKENLVHDNYSLMENEIVDMSDKSRRESLYRQSENTNRQPQEEQQMVSTQDEPYYPQILGAKRHLYKHTSSINEDTVLAPWKLAESSRWDELWDSCTSNKEAFSQADELGMKALHYAAMANAPEEIISRVLQTYPEAISQKSENGGLPLHFALNRQTSSSVIEMLLTANPQSTLEQFQGQSLLEIAKEREVNADVLAVIENFIEKCQLVNI